MSLSGRDAYREELTRLAEHDDRIICLEADLGGKDHPFRAAHPDRFVNVGIAEAAMLDIAGALAVAGFTPFVSTFAPFAALRAAESIKLTLVSYLGASVTVVAPYAGVSGAWFGTTHHCLEDLAVARSIPGLVIAAPYGDAEMRRVVRHAATSGRPHYIRTGRNARYDSLPGDTPVADPAGPVPPVIWDAPARTDEVCLISVGEEGTRLCLAAGEVLPDLGHRPPAPPRPQPPRAGCCGAPAARVPVRRRRGAPSRRRSGGRPFPPMPTATVLRCQRRPLVALRGRRPRRGAQPPRP